MPDIEYRKVKPLITPGSAPRQTSNQPEFAELYCTSNFSFLRGASHPEEYAQRAPELGYSAGGICDLNSLAGIVRGHLAAKVAGIPFLSGARVTLAYEPHDLSSDGTPPLPSLSALLYPTDVESYAALCSLLS